MKARLIHASVGVGCCFVRLCYRVGTAINDLGLHFAEWMSRKLAAYEQSL